MAKVTDGPASPSRAAYVRICPVCDAENPPEHTRCDCGASLAGVDFSLLAPPVAQAQPAEVPEARDALGDAAQLRCRHPDCAQPNPADAERCVYCNRSLHDDDSLVGARPLPRALRDHYRVVEAFPATGSEADILLVADRATGDKAVAKLYRLGIQPDFRLLEILSRAVGDTVVRVLDHGVSDGAAYEMLEYVPGGTLEALLRSGPLPKSDIRRIVEQVADALRGIHAHGILHRDLKPDNVLVRSTAPLSLALTDFGIASFAAATQHFTSAARTTRYAAPEVLTGVLDTKSDWWSLGMIVLEAASGRHPFDGLSEQVMNHQLATRPIDVRGVFDDDLRLLCRGLLLRDPQRRFGAAEVARWLAGDAALAVGPDSEVAASAVRPYRIGKGEATTAAELALALARNWDAAARDLARGQVARWLEHELHDHNLLRALRDIQERRDLTDDGRLLRFLLTAAPDLPPLWRGSPVTTDGVLAAARAAARGEETAIDWLDSLVRDDVLGGFARVDPALRMLQASWDAAWERFTATWNHFRVVEEDHARRARDLGGGIGVSFDDLVYAHLARPALPPRRMQNAALLLAGADAAWLEALRGEVVARLAGLVGLCPWLEAAWNDAGREPADVVAAHAVLPYASEAADRERRRQAATEEAHARTRAGVQDELRACVSRILALSPKPDESFAPDEVHELLSTFDAMQRACTAVERIGLADENLQRLRASAAKLSSFAAPAQRALARIEQLHGMRAILLTPQRIAGALAVLGVALVVRQPLILVGLLVVAIFVVAFGWYSSYHATTAALKRLQIFGLHARTFLRSTDPPEERVPAERSSG